MPELPEVECLARAVHNELAGRQLSGVRFLRRDLRDPIPCAQLSAMLNGTTVQRVWRRGKYLLVDTQCGTVILHLGMSGQLLWLDSPDPIKPHTHVIFSVTWQDDPSGFGSGKTPENGKSWLHFIDPRRFGRLGGVSVGEDPLLHPWLSHLGSEPLAMTSSDLADHLSNAGRGRKVSIKPFIMNHEIQVGVGNIYASEALFRAGIRPGRAAGRLTKNEWLRLADAIQTVLKESIDVGGTSFRDYLHSNGEEGLYALRLNVYERAGQPCQRCRRPIREIRQGNRASYFCPTCQK